MNKSFKRIFDIRFLFNLFIVGTLLYVGVSFLGVGGYTWGNLPLFDYIKDSSNFIPFKTIGTYLTAVVDGSLNISIPLKKLLGKLFIFAQTGFFLPYFNKKFKKVRSFIFSITSLLFIIEVIQFVTRGRFDIDDFILNLLSAFIGYGIWKNKKVQRFLKKMSKRFTY